jgi:hypothetical protein
MASDAADKVRHVPVSLFVVLWACFPVLIHTEEKSLPYTSLLSTEGCTIGVASARVTSDGRPLLWKIRDNADLPDNSVSYDTTQPHRFVAVANSGDPEVWMGVNEAGFAIINSTALDLPGGTIGLNNGLLMRHALGTCTVVEDFQHLLDSTNDTGRRTQANFGVIDARGSAMIFEVGGNVYYTFNASNPIQAPEGYILRTNFSMTGGGTMGIERYRRTVAQIKAFQLGDTLDYRRIIRFHARDFSDYGGTPIPVPYTHVWASTSPLGYFYSNVSVCRFKSVSAVAIVGVKPDEVPALSTMWTILGQPSSGIAVPYWPVGNTPDVARGTVTSPLNAIATNIRSLLYDLPGNPDNIDSYKLRDECGNGLWAWTFPAEDSIFNSSDGLLGRWRVDWPSTKQMLQAENGFASYALSQLTEAHTRLTSRLAFSVTNSMSYSDENGKILDNGDIVQLILAGEDGKIDPPNMEMGSPSWGQPTGDDRLIGIPHAIGENVSSPGTFHFQMIGWQNRTFGCPAVGDRVYLRAFNSNSLETATRYGDAQLYQISTNDVGSYDPLIEGAQTSRLLKGFRSSEVMIARFTLFPNFPNPFNASTIIEFEVPNLRDSPDAVELIVFNSLGQVVKSLLSGAQTGGRKKVEWDGKDDKGKIQPSGVYFARLRAGSTAETRRMLLIK